METALASAGKVNGQGTITVETGVTGHAEVDYTLGPRQGNNIVTANFSDNPGTSAKFFIFGTVRSDGAGTRFEGLILDNGSQPIQGVTCRLIVGAIELDPVMSGIHGQFLFEGVPAGPGTLRVDGSTAFHIGAVFGGAGVLPNSFPELEFDVIVVPDAVNSIGKPIFLPRLLPINAVDFDNTQDVMLTVDGLEGLEMLVKAGSMTLADGSIPSVDAPVMISLNQVHHDDVPMPMPDGAAPPFAWTLQPARATFDPPIQVTYPNLSGLAPGAIANFLSFQHDTGEFEIVATGSVTEDGTSIVSDPGSGITISGWGCNCPPYSVAVDCCECGDCESCSDGSCVSTCDSDMCQVCSCESSILCAITDLLGLNSGGGSCKSCSCVSSCDPDLCEVCVDGICKVPCDENECCLDGECVIPTIEFNLSHADVFPHDEDLRDDTSDIQTSIVIIWDPSRTKDLSKFVTVTPSSAKTSLVYTVGTGEEIVVEDDGTAFWTYPHLIPNSDRIARNTLEVHPTDCTDVTVSAVVVIVPQETTIEFSRWKLMWLENTDWFDCLPQVYGDLPSNSDPEPSEPVSCGSNQVCCPDQLWEVADSANGNNFHPGAAFAIRSEPIDVGTDPRAGHQATYDGFGRLIFRGLGTGSADRSHPSDLFGSDSHPNLDVKPFVWAAQLDGNPVIQRVTNLDRPLVRFGTHLQNYFLARPALPSSSFPLLLVDQCSRSAPESCSQ